MHIYYCYSCTEFFKVSTKKAKMSESIACPHCTSMDTEPAPEEENSKDVNKYASADDDCDIGIDVVDTEYDTYVDEVEGADKDL